jgi:hypothetical protein
LSAESEFGENDLKIEAHADANHFIDQNIRLGVFVAGAKLVPEEAGKESRAEVQAGELGSPGLLHVAGAGNTRRIGV